MQHITLSAKIAEYTIRNWKDLGYQIKTGVAPTRTIEPKVQNSYFDGGIQVYDATCVEEAHSRIKKTDADYAERRLMAVNKILFPYLQCQAIATALYSTNLTRAYVEDYMAFVLTQETVYTVGAIVMDTSALPEMNKEFLYSGFMAAYDLAATESKQPLEATHNEKPLYTATTRPANMRTMFEWRQCGFAPAVDEPQAYLSVINREPEGLFTITECIAPDYSNYRERRETFVQKVKGGSS